MKEKIVSSFFCNFANRKQTDMMEQIKGKISQIIGPVVDVQFSAERLPRIHDALTIERASGTRLVVEVQQHLGENTVRCVAMESTDGLRRGMEVVALGRPITMPTGDQVKGRLMNVSGDAIDGMDDLSREGALPIHREAPKFEELSPAQEVLGHQSDRPHRTVCEGRKDWSLRRCRCGQDGTDSGTYQ